MRPIPLGHYDAQLALVVGDGMKNPPELIDLWDAVELEVKLAEMRMLLGQLNILAVQYNSYGCWTNDWQVPPDQPLTGTAGGGTAVEGAEGYIASGNTWRSTSALTTV